MAKSPKQTTQSKSEFVRSLAATIPARDVVAKAKAAGLSLSAGYVYVIRSKRKEARGAGPAPTVSRAATVRTVAAPRADTSMRQLEAQFVDLVLDLGLPRAGELVQDLRGRVDRVTRPGA